MTREEAIKIEAGVQQSINSGNYDRIMDIATKKIDGYVALGLLSFNEPKSGHDVLRKIITNHVDEKRAACLLGAIKNAKLKIEV